MYDFINEMPYIILMSIPISFFTYILFPKRWKKRINLFFYIVFICYLLCVFLITIPPFFSFQSIEVQELLHFVNIIRCATSIDIETKNSYSLFYFHLLWIFTDNRSYSVDWYIFRIIIEIV